jgi:hypothetical protein
VQNGQIADPGRTPRVTAAQPALFAPWRTWVIRGQRVSRVLVWVVPEGAPLFGVVIVHNECDLVSFGDVHQFPLACSVPRNRATFRFHAT